MLVELTISSFRKLFCQQYPRKFIAAMDFTIWNQCNCSSFELSNVFRAAFKCIFFALLSCQISSISLRLLLGNISAAIKFYFFFPDLISDEYTNMTTGLKSDITLFDSSLVQFLSLEWGWCFLPFQEYVMCCHIHSQLIHVCYSSVALTIANLQIFLQLPLSRRCHGFQSGRKK